MPQLLTIAIVKRTDVRVVVPDDMSIGEARQLVEKCTDTLTAFEDPKILVIERQDISVEEADLNYVDADTYRVNDARDALVNEEVAWIEGENP